MYKIYNDDNEKILDQLYWTEHVEFDLIYADCIYNNKKFDDWIFKSFEVLSYGGIFMIQTDYHTVAEIKIFLDELGLHFINWAIYLQEWGGTSNRFFSRKHDDILIYAKGPDYKFYPERVQIPKATANTAFDKKGTGKKTPCDVFYDLGNFSTMSKERVKLNGKNIQWQKPLKLMNRLLLPFTDKGDVILDPFMGSGTTGVWSMQNRRVFFGIEKDKEVFNIAKERIQKEYDLHLLQEKSI